MSSAVQIFCGNCGAQGAVNKVTASLQCVCGSTDLGLVGVDTPKVVTASDYGHEEEDFDLGFEHGANGHPKSGASEAYHFGHDRGVSYAHSTGRFRTDHENYGKEAAQHVAYPQGPGTGWGKPQDLTRGWSEYQGPLPGGNPQSSAPVSDNAVCPACHGAGWDPMDSTVTCRECNGTGQVNAPTSKPPVESYDATTSGPPVGGARWASTRTAGRTSTDVLGSPEQHIRATTPGYSERGGYRPEGEVDPNNAATFYPKADTYSPLIQSREQPAYEHGNKPYQMDSSSCPNCDHSPTELRKDKNEDAWAVCPHCGPLANIDKHPEINPYAWPHGFTPDRSMKTSALLGRNKRTGKLLRIVATVASTNPGLHPGEVVRLARMSVASFAEK
jgi:hypothetical protein